MGKFIDSKWFTALGIGLMTGWILLLGFYLQSRS